MDFNFQSVHQLPSTYYTYSPNLPPPPNFCYFTQQAIQAGFTRPNPNPIEFEEAMRMQRELEKERIRAEIMRRRVLEEEVRREMMMERDFLMRFGSAVPMGLDPRVPLLANFEHREGFGGVRVSPHREMGFKGFESMPFQRDPVASGSWAGNRTPSSVVLQEIKTSDQDVPKEKLIILAKPSITSAADLKRKVATQAEAATSQLISGESKKQKTKDDWNCALCRVSATCERGLKDHLQGRKHTAKERGLLGHKTGFGTTPLPKKNTPLPKKNKHPKSPGLQNSLVSKEEENSVGKKKKRKGARAMVEKNSISPKPKKSFQFWCEICKVGTYSQNVLDDHMRGKRHLSNLLETETKPTKTSMENGANEEIKQEKGEEDSTIENGSVENNPTTTTGVAKDRKVSESGISADVTLAEDTSNSVVPENVPDLSCMTRIFHD